MSNLTTIVTFNKELGEKGWEEAKERVTRYCNLKTSQRDNSYQIANVLLTDLPATSFDHGAIITTKVDLSSIMTAITNQIQTRIQRELNIQPNDNLTVTKPHQMVRQT